MLRASLHAPSVSSRYLTRASATTLRGAEGVEIWRAEQQLTINPLSYTQNEAAIQAILSSTYLHVIYEKFVKLCVTKWFYDFFHLA